MPVTGLTVARMQLGRRLKVLRVRAGRTFAEVEAAHLGSRTKMWRIEKGLVAVSVPTVRALANFYGCNEQERVALEAMALGTGERSWSKEFGDTLPEWFRQYLELEAGADRVRTWEDSVIPGELQTADYARAVFAAAQELLDADAVEQRIRVRLTRQERLFNRAPEMIIVLGENVLARPVGGQEVMAAQIDHLRRLDQRNQIHIRVLPFAIGAHAAMTGAFRILDFPDDDGVIYVESQLSAEYLEQPEEVAQYRSIFELIWKQSVAIGDYR